MLSSLHSSSFGALSGPPLKAGDPLIFGRAGGERWKRFREANMISEICSGERDFGVGISSGRTCFVDPP